MHRNNPNNSMQSAWSVHSMATANLNKSEEFVTNTTAASKYIPKGQLISKCPFGVIVSTKIPTKKFVVTLKGGISIYADSGPPRYVL